MNDLRYRLAIEVRDDTLDYEASVEISARDLPRALSLDSVGHTVRSVRSEGRPVTLHRPDGAPDRLELSGLPTGAHSVRVEFSGRVDDHGLRGFHVSPLGPGRIYSTYLEPTGARRLLPCLDRPDEKAVFEVEVVAPDSSKVISNTLATQVEPLEGHRRRHRFAPTPPMSTYLLYLGIGPFEELASERSDPQVILATSPGTSAQGRFALE